MVLYLFLALLLAPVVLAYPCLPESLSSAGLVEGVVDRLPVHTCHDPPLPDDQLAAHSPYAHMRVPEPVLEDTPRCNDPSPSLRDALTSTSPSKSSNTSLDSDANPTLALLLCSSSDCSPASCLSVDLSTPSLETCMTPSYADYTFSSVVLVRHHDPDDELQEKARLRFVVAISPGSCTDFLGIPLVNKCFVLQEPCRNFALFLD